MKKIMRSATSGEFTTAAEVAAHPETTVTETVPSKMKPRRKTTKPRKRPKKK